MEHRSKRCWISSLSWTVQFYSVISRETVSLPGIVSRWTCEGIRTRLSVCLPRSFLRTISCCPSQIHNISWTARVISKKRKGYIFASTCWWPDFILEVKGQGHSRPSRGQRRLRWRWSVESLCHSSVLYACTNDTLQYDIFSIRTLISWRDGQPNPAHGTETK